MGSFDGAEIWLYIQSKLENILLTLNFGLYRDNGLALFRNLNGQQTNFFVWLRFTPCKAEQSLRTMELQENKAQKG